MTSRIGQQPRQQLASEIQSLFDDLNMLKAATQAVGGDSAVMRMTQNPTPDINGYPMVHYAVKNWRVIFTPNVMKNAYAALFFTLTISGGTGYEQYDYHPDSANTTATQVAWIFSLAADASSITVYAQFGVTCPDNGTLTVVGI